VEGQTMSDSQKNLRLVLTVTRTCLFLVLASLIALLAIFGSPVFLWVILTVAALLVLTIVVWHARRTVYICKSCKHVFQITAWIDFISPHLGGVKLLRCPKCGSVGWCESGRA
jgi:hypothetical protein